MGEVILRVSNILLSLLIVFLFHACYVVHKQTVVDFDYCYNGTKTCIEEQININGYYTIDYVYKDEKTDKENLRTEVLIFLDDGIYIEAPSIDFFLNVTESEKWDSEGFDMGIYNIDNDTIWVEYVHIGSSTSACVTVIYEIIDSVNLKKVFYGNCDNPPKAFINNHSVSTAKFISYNLPFIDRIWIKKMEWFWCDEIKFKEWKKQNK